MQGKNYLHSIRQVCPRWLYLILCATQPFIPKKLGGNLKRQTNKYQEGWKNYHNAKYLYHLVNTSRTTSKNNRMVIGSRNTLTWSANKRQIYISCWKKKPQNCFGQLNPPIQTTSGEGVFHELHTFWIKW